MFKILSSLNQIFVVLSDDKFKCTRQSQKWKYIFTKYICKDYDYLLWSTKFTRKETNWFEFKLVEISPNVYSPILWFFISYAIRISCIPTKACHMKEYESAKALKLHFTGMTNKISLLDSVFTFCRRNLIFDYITTSTWSLFRLKHKCFVI